MYLFCYFFSSFELYIRESLWREINEALGVSEMGISPCGILSCWTHSYTLFLVPTSRVGGRGFCCVFKKTSLSLTNNSSY